MFVSISSKKTVKTAATPGVTVKARDTEAKVAGPASTSTSNSTSNSTSTSVHTPATTRIYAAFTPTFATATFAYSCFYFYSCYFS